MSKSLAIGFYLCNKAAEPFTASRWYISGQITIIPEPKSRGFQMDSLTEQPFGVTLVELAIICPDLSIELPSLKLTNHA